MHMTKETGTEDDLVASHAEAPGGGAYVRTFGAFCLFVNGEEVKFRLRKCKEFLAYLVDKRGAVVPMSEMIAALWPGHPEDKAKLLYRNAKCRLCMLLRGLGLNDALILGYARARLDPAALACDMWDYLDDETDKSYGGEYMTDYAWSAATRSRLEIVALRRGFAVN